MQHSSPQSSEQVVIPPIISEDTDNVDPVVATDRPWWRTTWAPRLALILILLLGGYFRTLSLWDWADGTGQHPDERFFTDVASSVRVPANVSEYFDASISPGNPRNVEKTFYVYGAFPIALTRFVAVTLTPTAALPETVPNLRAPPDPATGTRPQIPNPELDVPKLTPLQMLVNPEGNDLTNYHQIYKVGRSLVALFDLAAIVVIFLLGRRLFDTRVGLLAALLAALAVMPIQQSHFFVDPIFSTFFAVLALYWAVRIAQGGGWGSYVALGITIGFAMANRITLATLGLVAIVAAGYAAFAWHTARAAATDANDTPPSRSFGDYFLTRSLPLLCLAGILTLLTFRTLQPDAFIGSSANAIAIPGKTESTLDFMQGWGFFDVRPDPRWIENLQRVQGLVTGETDTYPSQQWVQRTDYLFPWQNMVIWGMGPALGATVWLGWLVFGVRLLAFGRNAQRQLATPLSRVLRLQNAGIVLWIWISFYFLWQGRQFASTMRYMLPIYGALIVLGAWLLIALWDWSRQPHASLVPKWLSSFLQRPQVRPLGRWALVVVVLATLSWAYAFTRIYTQPHSRVIAAHWMLEHAPPGSKIISEAWDDALPLAVAGGNWGTTYQGITTQPYGEDDPNKYFGSFNAEGEYQPGLLDQLEEADYITLTSNRVYGSTERLPMRYPALRNYYHHLFTGELGFELVADITSYPRLLGFPIPDQGAEEAFTVYDHPRVLIFEKTDAFSREKAEQLITDEINWGEVYKLPVSLADRTDTALRLTTSEWPEYRDAGTWSNFFDRQSAVNAFAPLVWLLVLQVIGLAMFALLFRLLPWLPDRGFALARPLGLLLVAYAAWLLGSLNLLAFTPTTVWLCAVPLLLGGAWVAWRSRTELWSFGRKHTAMLLTAEAIYLGAFVLLLGIRWLNPDLWHPARGGEKPMDLAYLNAVLKSAAFPPYDPWFAGGYINYYYFGFVIVGTLIHLTTIIPSIAYNLAVPTLFALTALGAWGVVYNLLAPRRRRAQTGAITREDGADEPRVQLTRRWQRAERRARISALLAPLFVVLVGNLAQAIWFLNGYAADQQGRTEWAFWDATRIVDGTVNEFPFFTFLFADLHAHMIVMPFSLALLGLLVALIRQRRTTANTTALALFTHPASLALIGLLGLLAGTLRVTNTWDYPTYVGLTGATLAALTWWQIRRTSSVTRRFGLLFAQFVLPFSLIVLIGNVLFLPFVQHFVTESSGAELLREGLASSPVLQVLLAQRTPLWDLLRIHGLWLFLLTSAGLLLASRRLRFAPWQIGAVAGILVVLTLFGLLLGLSAPLLLLPLLLGALLLLWRLRHTSPRTLLPLLWATAGLGLAVLVEFVVVRGDVGRMNTVFKFGIHTWTLFGLAAAVALPWSWQRLTTTPVALRRTWYSAAIVLVAAALVYPLTATPARISDRYAEDLPTTLDGAAFMTYVDGSTEGQSYPLEEDAAAIQWLQQNVSGTPVILEAHLPSYQWAGRVATFTGLPTVLGWEWHQIQQRNAVSAMPIISYRQETIRQIYNDLDIQQALQHIDDYAIEYIYVGGVERALYDATGLAKFPALAAQGTLDPVFASDNTTIYRVTQPGAPAMLTSDLPLRTPQTDTPPPLRLDQPVGELPPVGGYAWNEWASTNSWAAVLVWLAALYGLALLGLPLAVVVFGTWRDSGVVWARLLGLLLLGYAVWLPTSLGIWHYDMWGVLGGLLLVVGLNLGLLAWMGRSAETAQPAIWHGVRVLGQRMRAGRRGILISESLFLGGFALFVLLRALNPDLWHPIWGGEKPMEMGFLNAILRSPVMPPYDPFFSDGYINYYYYGLYLVSLPIKLTGIAPAVAFNLIIPTLFGLTLVGGYAIVTQITRRVRYGLLGAAFLAIFGNLGSITTAGWSRGLGPVAEALRTEGLGGFGAALGDWYVGPSRIIPETINEFPFWSFLFADLHPHLIALPITLLMIALAYQTIGDRRSGATRDGRLEIGCRWGLIALTLGTLAVTNSWDFPTYTLLLVAVLMGAVWRSARGQPWPWLGLMRAVLLAGALAVGGMVLYAPFFDHFYALVSGIDIVRDSTTISEYVIIYGLFLAVLLPALFGAAWRLLARRRVQAVPALPLVEQADAMPAVAVNPAPPPRRRRRFAGPLLVAIVAILVIVTLALPDVGLRLWLVSLLLLSFVLLLQRRLAPATWFVLLLATLGWAVSLGIETVYIADHLAGGDAYRMNTVFKFGLQIWTLLALAAAASFPRLLHGLRRIGGTAAQTGGLVVLGVLVLATAVFPLVGPPSRIANRFPEAPGPTLDGLAFLQQAEFTYNCEAYRGCEPGAQILTIDLEPDAAAIAWLNENIVGTPVVLQSNLWFYRAYGVRVAANTGLPTVISGLHVNEQRDPEIARLRNDEVDAFFRTSDIEQALRLLAKYGVNYIYVGSIEHAFYNDAGLEKFSAMVGTYLDMAYEQPGVQIYQVRDLPAAYAEPEPFDFAAEEPVVLRPSTAEDTASSPELQALEELLAVDPTNSAVAFGLAERYREQGQPDEAAAVLAAAAAAHPEDTALHHLWGDILADAGRYQEAEKVYLQAARDNPTAGNWNKLGTALLGWGELDKAEIALDQALSIDASAAEPYYRLGQLYHQRGNDDQAAQSLEAYLDRAPEGPYAAEVQALLDEIKNL